jgi:peptidyl-prolyl cis-trans isomerase SurA
MRVRIGAAVALSTLMVGTALAQQPANGDILQDRVVAVVGDTVLLQSDVFFALGQLQAAGQIPNDPAAFEQVAQRVFETKVDELVLVAAARQAGMTVPEEQINERVEQQIRDIQRQFGSEIAFTAALAREGRTRDQYRQEMAATFRDQELVQQYLATRLRNRARPVIDEREIREFFDERSTALGQRPATVSFRQVIVTPRPSPEARQAAVARAEEVLQEIRTGADFAVLARRFSDDPGSREHGGDLGWFQTGRMVPEFERVAFALRPGQTSGIVETDYGFHIIRVERARGAERQARHILITPELSDGDVQVARTRADSVATAIRGGESITTLATRYNPAGETSTAAEQVDRLPPDYAAAFAAAAVGDVVGPFLVEGPRGGRWVVARITERSEARPYTLEDVREQIRQAIQQERMMEQLLIELRDQIYVDIQV